MHIFVVCAYLLYVHVCCMCMFVVCACLLYVHVCRLCIL